MATAVRDVLALAPVSLQAPRSRLRFLTCGSVDDGKSTLIGRLLYESKLLYEDQVATLEKESRKAGAEHGALDFALLVDGLAAEREQGITIDVAYRYFSTGSRMFIVADTPGHEQYTRNMATAASSSDLAVLLIDARKGILTQTRRHSFIVSMLGVRHVILAVNKMDLVGYSQQAFRKIEDDYRAFAAPLGFTEISCIPISAKLGDNVIDPSADMPWYRGRSLLEHLESVEIEEDLRSKPFRMPVQWVNRPDADFRGYAGLIASGTVRVGEKVRVLPSGKETAVQRIVTFDGDLPVAVAGQSVTLVLADEIDVSRGDLLCAPAAPAHVADRLSAKVLWLSETPLQPQKPYLIKIGTKRLPGALAKPEHAIDIATLGEKAAATLAMNEIGVCTVSLDAPVAFDAYADNRDTGSFIVIDRMTNNTVGMGLLLAAPNGHGSSGGLFRSLSRLIGR
jgi:bifunctional enzyme CysN/CysC